MSPGALVVKQSRDYQIEACDAFFEALPDPNVRPLLELPTGSGKSFIIAEIIKRAMEMDHSVNFLILAHVAELLVQNAEEINSHVPDARVTFYAAKLGQRDLTGNAVCASIQSIYKRAYDFRHTVDIILIDEAHLLSEDDDSMYRRFLDDMWKINPNIRIGGLTASPFRTNYGYLHRGKNPLFTHIVYRISIIDLINRGHLTPIVTPQVKTQMDVSAVKVRGGDYVAGQLEKAVDDTELTKACVSEMMELGADRKKWLVFTAGIEHCQHVRDEIRARGISCEMIHGKTPTAERNSIVDRYKNGNLKCLVNVMVFVVGFNNPSIDFLVFMRPTKSPVLYLQACGRGMRTFPNKVDCLLADFAGCVQELGPIDQLHIKEKEEGDGEAPIKYCESCGKSCAAGCATCPHCGAPFPENGLNLDVKASNAAVLSSQLKPQIHAVTHVSCFLHKKEGKPNSMRVDYLCGFETYREWICFSHTSVPREKACAWWRNRTDTMPPATTEEALRRSAELRTPTEIQVRRIGKYHEIVGWEF